MNLGISEILAIALILIIPGVTVIFTILKVSLKNEHIGFIATAVFFISGMFLTIAIGLSDEQYVETKIDDNVTSFFYDKTVITFEQPVSVRRDVIKKAFPGSERTHNINVCVFDPETNVTILRLK